MDETFTKSEKRESKTFLKGSYEKSKGNLQEKEVN